jgi:hypothetical protein
MRAGCRAPPCLTPGDAARPKLVYAGGGNWRGHAMYFLMIVLLMAVLPIVSIAIEWTLGHGTADFVYLVGRWFVFWAGGVRLAIAGIRQIAQPGFTARDIFGIEDKGAESLVREIGFANVSIGLLGLLTIIEPNWTAAAAIASGLYYGLAGGLHLLRGERNATEAVAMISDLAIFVVLALYLAFRALHMG